MHQRVPCCEHPSSMFATRRPYLLGPVHLGDHTEHLPGSLDLCENLSGGSSRMSSLLCCKLFVKLNERPQSALPPLQDGRAPIESGFRALAGTALVQQPAQGEAMPKLRNKAKLKHRAALKKERLQAEW